MFKSSKQYTYEERLERLMKAQVQSLQQTNRQRTRLHIVYVVGNPSICGANKIIFEQANRLRLIGLEVSIVAYGEKPEWFPINVNYIQVPFNHQLALWIPYCHVIIATYYTHIHECVQRHLAPVIYFEQGDLHLFQYEELDVRQQLFIRKQYSLVQFVMTVSKPSADLIKDYFGKIARVIPNAIDHKIFYPLRTNDIKNESCDVQYLLMIGRDDVTFKAIREIIAFYKAFKKVYKDILLYWITPNVSDQTLIHHVSKVFINPSQPEIGELIRNAFALISASYYESCSLPVLEAMASGCPVISADNIGVCDYGEDGVNILIYPKGNLYSLMDQCQRVIKDKKLRRKLIKGGIKTAEKYQWDFTIEKLYSFIHNISSYEVLPRTISVAGEGGMVQILNYAKELYNNGIYDEAMCFLDTYIQCEEEPLSLRVEASRMRYLAHYYQGDISKSRYYCFQTFELTIPQEQECEFISRTFLEEKRSIEASFWNLIIKETI